MEFDVRDYILTQAHSRQNFGVVETVKRMAQNWKHQRALVQLLKLDDYLLKDMGLTRPLVQHLLSLPLTVDVDWEKERLLRMR
jgi:uncharacterized protein YjiS (DUF1127 family)